MYLFNFLRLITGLKPPVFSFTRKNVALKPRFGCDTLSIALLSNISWTFFEKCLLAEESLFLLHILIVEVVDPTIVSDSPLKLLTTPTDPGKFSARSLETGLSVNLLECARNWLFWLWAPWFNSVALTFDMKLLMILDRFCTYCLFLSWNDVWPVFLVLA